MGERLGQVDSRVLSPDAAPDRPAADTSKHDQRAEGDHSDLDEQARPAREPSTGWLGRLLEQVGKHGAGTLAPR